MANIALKAGPTVHVVLVRVSRDDDGNVVLTKQGALYDTLYKGAVLVHRAKTPFYTSARHLLAKGVDPADVISMRWEDQPHTTSMAGRVGYVAKMTIVENEVLGPVERKYVPWDANTKERLLEADGVAVGMAKLP